MFEYTGKDIIANLKNLYANFAPRIERVNDEFSVAGYPELNRSVVIGESGFIYLQNVDMNSAKHDVLRNGTPSGASYAGRAVDVMRWLHK